MPARNIPESVRPLFQIEKNEPATPDDKPEITNRPDEARRVVKRISSIINEHRRSSIPLGVELGTSELRIVIAALRDHALGGPGSLDLTGRDEIQSHCLNRLFEELVEEPGNILYTTQTGPETIRYDAMDSAFWIECLDLLEKSTSQN